MLVAGDLYDSAAPSASAQRLVVRTLMALADRRQAGRRDRREPRPRRHPRRVPALRRRRRGHDGGSGAHGRVGRGRRVHLARRRAGDGRGAAVPLPALRRARRGAGRAVPGGEHEHLRPARARPDPRADRRVPHRRGEPRDGAPDRARAARSAAASAPHSRSSSTRCPRRSSRRTRTTSRSGTCTGGSRRPRRCRCTTPGRRWPSTSASRTTRASCCWSRPRPPRRPGSPRSRSRPGGGCGRCTARSPSSPACATRSATTCCASGCGSGPGRGCARRSPSCCRTRWRCGSTPSSPRR